MGPTRVLQIRGFGYIGASVRVLPGLLLENFYYGSKRFSVRVVQCYKSFYEGSLKRL